MATSYILVFLLICYFFKNYFLFFSFLLSLGRKHILRKAFYFNYMFYIWEKDWFRSHGLGRPYPARMERASIFLCCLVSCFQSDVYVSDESRNRFQLDKVISIDIFKYSVKPLCSKNFIWSLKLRLSGLGPKAVSMCGWLSVGRIWHDWSHVPRFCWSIFVLCIARISA